MSRIGKKPVEIPQGIEVKIDGQTVSAKGPLGTEVVEVRPEIAVKLEDNHVVLSKVGTSRETDALYGLSRTLVANAIQGVKELHKLVKDQQSQIDLLKQEIAELKNTISNK